MKERSTEKGNLLHQPPPKRNALLETFWHPHFRKLQREKSKIIETRFRLYHCLLLQKTPSGHLPPLSFKNVSRNICSNDFCDSGFNIKTLLNVMMLRLFFFYFYIIKKTRQCNKSYALLICSTY